MQNQQQHHGAPPPSSLSADGKAAAATIAERHGFSVDAVAELIGAVARGRGRQAQFNHPELGGMGQWSHGGMVMVGDMFDNGLKTRVASLCQDIASLLERENISAPTDGQSSLFLRSPSPDEGAWPASLGRPSSSGSQNGIRYAVFPQYRRLAIEVDGKTTIYDTAEHQISGFGQQQGDAGSLSLTSQNGPVHLEDLAIIGSEQASSAPQVCPRPTASYRSHASDAASESDRAIFAKIEGLADLLAKNLLSDAEYDAKKAELLARL